MLSNCRCDGIGRRSGLKIHRWRQRTGSSPVTGTITDTVTDRIISVAVSVFYPKFQKTSLITELLHLPGLRIQSVLYVKN